MTALETSTLLGLRKAATSHLQKQAVVGTAIRGGKWAAEKAVKNPMGALTTAFFGHMALTSPSRWAKQTKQNVAEMRNAAF